MGLFRKKGRSDIDAWAKVMIQGYKKGMPIDIKDVVYRGYGGAAGPVDLRLARTVVERRPESPSR